MSKTDFWVVVAAFYLALVGVVLAGISRFGAEYMLRTFADPSAKIVMFLVLFLLPLPFILRRKRDS